MQTGLDTHLQSGNDEQKPVWLRAFDSSVEITYGNIPYTSAALDRVDHIMGNHLHEQVNFL